MDVLFGVAEAAIARGLMNIIVMDALDPPSQERLEAMEEYCEEKLPSDFKIFLQLGNGGRPVKGAFMHGERGRLIERFLPILNDPTANEQGQYDIEVIDAQIGERLGDDPDATGRKLIPIAAIFGGDFLCLDYRRDREHPAIVLWDHEKSTEFSPHTEYVARSFSALEDLLE